MPLPSFQAALESKTKAREWLGAVALVLEPPGRPGHASMLRSRKCAYGWLESNSRHRRAFLWVTAECVSVHVYAWGSGVELAVHLVHTPAELETCIRDVLKGE